MAEGKQLVDLQFYGNRDKLKKIEEALRKNEETFAKILEKLTIIEMTLKDSNRVMTRKDVHELISDAIATHTKQESHCSVHDVPGSASKADLDALRLQIESEVWEQMDHVRDIVMQDLASNLQISFGGRDRW